MIFAATDAVLQSAPLSFGSVILLNTYTSFCAYPVNLVGLSPIFDSCQAEKLLGRNDAHRKPLLPHLPRVAEVMA
jgi:hypothetical protein